MRFAAEIIGCLVIVAIFCFGLYRISEAMDRMAKLRQEQEEAAKHKPEEPKQ